MPEIRESYYRIEENKFPMCIVTKEHEGEITIEQDSIVGLQKIYISRDNVPKLIDLLKKISND